MKLDIEIFCITIPYLQNLHVQLWGTLFTILLLQKKMFHLLVSSLELVQGTLLGTTDLKKILKYQNLCDFIHEWPQSIIEPQKLDPYEEVKQ